MQRQDKNTEAKVEIFGNLDGIIEVRYFDTPKDESYRSWKLPRPVAEELIKWWRMTKINQKTIFPINSRTGICEFTMHTEKFIGIKEIDSLGRTKMTGWSLPSEIPEKLIIWQKQEGCKK